MIKFSQNKKIAISAISIFIISFSIMVFFLKNSPKDAGKEGQANVIHSTENSTESTSEGSKGAVDTEKTYRSYLKNTKNPIFVVDTEDKFIYVSSDFCDLINTRCNILMGSLFLDYIHGKDLAAFVIDHNKVIQHGKEMTSVGPYRINNNDSEHLVLFDIYPLLEAGKVKSMVFGVKDITEKVEEMSDKKDPSVTPEDKTEGKPEVKKDERKKDQRLMVDKNKLSYNINIIDRLFR